MKGVGRGVNYQYEISPSKCLALIWQKPLKTGKCMGMDAVLTQGDARGRTH